MSAIDSNHSLENVEKMNYLLSLLKSEAEATVKGLPLCNENYEIALKMLEERFGDPNVLISSHMNKLLNLDTINNPNNLKGMRNLCDNVESQVRCLNALGQEAKNYGAILVPIFMQKIPEELKLIISRKLEKENSWDIQFILNSFKLELEAREKIFATNSSKANSEFQLSTMAQSNNSGSSYTFIRFVLTVTNRSTVQSLPKNQRDLKLYVQKSFVLFVYNLIIFQKIVLQK